ncbi:MAG: hypothetical protein HDS54_08620 [Barnesiella sp.]|nr:hypothetical protein [Barnesiella sp.]MBD5259104.1 hypothetical protein [Barnesiella sp.]
MRLKKSLNRNVVIVVAAALLVVAAIMVSDLTPRPAADNYDRILDEVQP